MFPRFFSLPRRIVVASALASLATACAVFQPAGAGLGVGTMVVKGFEPAIYLFAFTTYSPLVEGQVRTSIQEGNHVGVTLADGFLLVSDPYVHIQTVQPIDIPSALLVNEQIIGPGSEVVEVQVSRKPLFVLETVTVDYKVTGRTVPSRTLTYNEPIKSNDHRIRLPVSVEPTLLAALLAEPATDPVLGTMHVSMRIRDLNPFAASPTFTAERDFPFSYTRRYATNTTAVFVARKEDLPGIVTRVAEGSANAASAVAPVRNAEDGTGFASPSPEPVPVLPTDTPTASPSPVPSPTPSPSPSPSPVPSPSTLPLLL